MTHAFRDGSGRIPTRRRRAGLLSAFFSGVLPSGLPAQSPVIRHPAGVVRPIDGIDMMELSGDTDLPSGAVVAFTVTGLWPDLDGLKNYATIPPIRATAADQAIREQVPLNPAFPCGRYRVTAELIPVDQTDSAVALRYARRRPPVPVSFELCPGTTADWLRDVTEARARLEGQVKAIEEALTGLASYARARQRSAPEESALLTALSDLNLSTQGYLDSPRPPFLGSSSDLVEVVQDLGSSAPAPLTAEDSDPAGPEDADRPADPQAIFADGRIEKQVATARTRLTEIRSRIGKEHANAILGEVERACRRLAEAYRTSAANPRDWADAVREARESADQLLTAASAPEASALGGKGPNHVALLQAFTSQLEARPPAPPPADGEAAADPKLPADVAEGIENVARSLQAARSKLAS